MCFNRLTSNGREARATPERIPVMAVLKRNGRFVVDFINPYLRGDRIRKTAPVQTEKAARKYETQLLTACLNGSVERTRANKRGNSNSPLLFAQLCDDYLSRMRIEDYAKSTIRNAEVRFSRHLVPLFGSCRIDELTEQGIAELKRELREGKGLKASAANTVLTQLKTVLNWAVSQKYINRGNVPEIKHIKGNGEGPVSADMWWTESEYSRLVKLSSNYLRFAILLGGDAGLRLSEMCGLQWKDIDFSVKPYGVLHVVRASTPTGGITSRLKSKHSYRSVPLTKGLHDALREREDFSSEFIVPCVAWRLRILIKGIVNVAGISKGTPHKLRHTFCSHLAIKGVSAQTIQKLAGHSSIVITSKYMHLNQDATTAAIMKLGR